MWGGVCPEGQQNESVGGGGEGGERVGSQASGLRGGAILQARLGFESTGIGTSDFW